jgi:hypothetical protein
MTPPRDEPDDAMPTARPIRVLNQVGISDTVGTKSRPPPIPTQKAWESNACQYSVHSESIMRPKTIMKLPEARRRRR